MNQDWFEFKELEKRFYDNAVWIPLRASITVISQGKYGYDGYVEEFFGSGSLAVPNAKKVQASRLNWDSLGISHGHESHFEGRKYVPCDVYTDPKFSGINLVLEQFTTKLELREWYLHQDLVIALKLRRESDTWVCPEEGYIDVVKLTRNDKGSPVLLEIRAEFLKDYLCARNLNLRITSYRSRRKVTINPSSVDWKERYVERIKTDEKWIGSISEVHEGGDPFGASTSVIHVERTDVDTGADVPVMNLPTGNESFASKNWTVKSSGKKLYFTQGQFWRDEWVNKGRSSSRVRGDKVAPTVFFITDASGKLESKKTLDKHGRWLWFRPELIMALAHRRGGFLEWYTRNTGQVGCSPGRGIHFGVNNLGFINVYAKDIAFLPDWQQKVWAAFNISPDGGVSKELQDSQVNARPANTQAPERFFQRGLISLNDTFNERFKTPLLIEHGFIDEIIERTHRFRAIDDAGLFALAKDVARLTADLINPSVLHAIVAPPKGEKWGSLKSLEKVIALKIGEQKARELLGPLVGIYKMRHADAHLPGSELEEALALVGIDKSDPKVFQGLRLLFTTVSSIYSIRDIFKEWDK